MKPAVTKLADVPRTAVLYGPSCYRMISHTSDQLVICCDACDHSFSQSPSSSDLPPEN
ncbi:MAG: hypothetical protein LZF86_110982 [Nitrospira sp.]|nr:MAG: hypothetical protein LZF86_110982 [Nitrospira sp.]